MKKRLVLLERFGKNNNERLMKADGKTAFFWFGRMSSFVLWEICPLDTVGMQRIRK